MNKIIFFLLTILAIISFNCHNQNKDSFDEGVKYWNSKQYDKAIVEFSNSLKANPQNIEALYYRAVCNVALNNFGIALVDLQKAIELNPDYADALYAIGVIKLKLKDKEGAFIYFNKACQLGDKDACNHLEEYFTYEQRKSYERNFNRKDDVFNNLMSRAFQYSKTKNYYETLNVLDQLIKMYPENSESYIMRGFIKAQTHKYRLACEDFEDASKLGDSLKAKYLIKTYCGDELKDFPIYDFEELIVFLEGVQKAKIGNLKKAKEDFDKVIQLNPLNYEAYYLRSGTKFHKYKDEVGALNDLYTAIKINPNHSNAFYLKANIYQAINQVDSAISNYTTSIKLNPNLADAYYYRGVLYIMKGMKKKGCEDLSKAELLNYPYAAETIKENCK